MSLTDLRFNLMRAAANTIACDYADELVEGDGIGNSEASEACEDAFEAAVLAYAKALEARGPHGPPRTD